MRNFGVYLRLLLACLFCGLLFLIAISPANAVNITINQIIRGVAAAADGLPQFDDPLSPYKDSSGETNNGLGVWNESVSAYGEYNYTNLPNYPGTNTPLYFGDLLSFGTAEAEQNSNIVLSDSLLVSIQGR